MADVATTTPQADKILQHDYHMSAQEALKHGFIDKIIKSFSEIKLRGW